MIAYGHSNCEIQAWIALQFLFTPVFPLGKTFMYVFTFVN